MEAVLATKINSQRSELHEKRTRVIDVCRMSSDMHCCAEKTSK